MVTHRVAGSPLDFAALRAELAVAGDFPSDVLADAERSAVDVQLPDEGATHIPFVTVDPAGSRDLDQALHIAREGDGFLVSYAIPDVRVPLHPPVLSEGAASLLPEAVRPAVLWRMTLDATGDVRAVDVRRAR